MALAITACSSVAAWADTTLFSHRFSADGEDRWHLLCSKDAFTDEVACQISPIREGRLVEDAGFRVVVRREQVAATVASPNIYPESDAWLRVDDRAARVFKAGAALESRSDGHSVFDELLAGSVLRTRHFDFPYQNRPIDREVPLAGFGRSLEVAREIISGHAELLPEERLHQAEHTGAVAAFTHHQLALCGQKKAADEYIAALIRHFSVGAEQDRFRSAHESVTKTLSGSPGLTQTDPESCLKAKSEASAHLSRVGLFAQQ